MPCSPVCHHLSPFANGSPPFSSPVAPPPRVPLVGFCFTPPVASPSSVPLRTNSGVCVALPALPRLVVLPPCHAPCVCFKNPQHHFHAFMAALGHRSVSSPNTTGECSVEPWVARSFLRASTMSRFQVLNRPPGLVLYPRATLPNIARRCNRGFRLRIDAVS